MIAIGTKERILQAANDVAVRDGVIHLTLEAVAAEAGLSKGGLLYHFPNKDALVAGLVARLTQRFESSLEAAREPDATTPGAFTRAFIEATFDGTPAAQGLHAGLLTAVLLNPSLLRSFQKKFDNWHEKIRDDGLNPTLASLLRYAADGLWASELLGLAPPSRELRGRLRELMLRLARQDVCRRIAERGPDGGDGSAT